MIQIKQCNITSERRGLILINTTNQTNKPKNYKTNEAISYLMHTTFLLALTPPILPLTKYIPDGTISPFSSFPFHLIL